MNLNSLDGENHSDPESILGKRMTTKSSLLAMPLEIQRHIYSYVLANDGVLDIVVSDMDGPLRQGLFKVCSHIYHEAKQIYWNTNMFSLCRT